MVVTFSDSEEHMIQKIMDVLRDEPAVEHSLEPSYASNVLTFFWFGSSHEGADCLQKWRGGITDAS